MTGATQKPDYITYHRKPTPWEIRFGEGAIHYRDFPRAEVSKTNGAFKKWFIADDGLRYYYY